MREFFPPNSSDTFFKFLLADSPTLRPACVEAVNWTIAMFLSDVSAAPYRYLRAGHAASQHEYTITPAVIQEKDKAGLRDLRIRVDGEFEVRLPQNAQVMSHNAVGTPDIFSRAYVWNVGSIDVRPNIRFRL